MKYTQETAQSPIAPPKKSKLQLIKEIIKLIKELVFGLEI